MNQDQLKKILKRFTQQHILVVGDCMLDVFVWGNVSRISPEAPVPVVQVTKESYFPGGAANVARNLYDLGAKLHILGVVGDDQEGRILRDTLEKNKVDASGLITDPSRPTTVKTRVIAHHQQVVRFDRENTAPIRPVLQKKLIDHFRRVLPSVDAVIFEDYAKGLLTQEMLDGMLSLAQQEKKITAADPNPRRRLNHRGLTAITPNRVEAFTTAGVPYADPFHDVLSDHPLMEVGRILLDQWQPRNLLITLGEHGMCLFRRGEKPHHIPTVAQEVFDVSGAGDTVIATLVLALAAGADPVEAAEISNHAAGIVVGKVGTATCSPKELMESCARNRR